MRQKLCLKPQQKYKPTNVRRIALERQGANNLEGRIDSRNFYGAKFLTGDVCEPATLRRVAGINLYATRSSLTIRFISVTDLISECTQFKSLNKIKRARVQKSPKSESKECSRRMAQ